MQPARQQYIATPARASYLRRPTPPEPPAPRELAKFDTLATIAAILSLDLPPTARLVAIALAKRANTLGICWPSTGRIAADCATHRVSARRAMRQLIAAGVIIEAPAGAQYPNGIPAKAKARIVTFQPRTGAQTLPTEGEQMSPIATNSPHPLYRMIHLKQREAGAQMTPKTPPMPRNAAEPIRFSQILRIVPPRTDPTPTATAPERAPTPQTTTPASEAQARQVLATYRGAQSVYPRSWLDFVTDRFAEGATPAELVSALAEAKTATWFAANAGRQTPGFVFASLDRVLGLAHERASRESRAAARAGTVKRLAESGSALPSRERPQVAHGAFVPDWSAIEKAIDGR
jgi:hypothetical protein